MLRIAKAGGRPAVTGVPGFICELRQLARLDPDYDRAIAFTIGLICGHQKSTSYADAIAWEHRIKPGNLRRIDFRKKVAGRRADEYITEVTGLIDGIEVTRTLAASEVFARSWSRGFFKPRFSDYTDDVFNECADIAIGDAWLPQYASDSSGENLLILRNTVIEAILREGAASGALHLDTPSARSRASSATLMTSCRTASPGPTAGESGARRREPPRA